MNWIAPVVNCCEVDYRWHDKKGQEVNLAPRKNLWGGTNLHRLEIQQITVYFNENTYLLNGSGWSANRG